MMTIVHRLHGSARFSTVFAMYRVTHLRSVAPRKTIVPSFRRHLALPLPIFGLIVPKPKSSAWPRRTTWFPLEILVVEEIPIP